ncbi:sensor histidine kinase [Umezawaea endophytica]|uniref:Oxygen sensor histidine kinase NreB n=1 Tax=Umezawaea endophytica TaxID=1654476 RepID=A0A9X2ZZ56_9PSEU|nr:sensor histidine kinase [Umezawaea endophytica]MCS7475558.1 sensor histidine kinase [Umezawaea endophytica]
MTEQATRWSAVTTVGPHALLAFLAATTYAVEGPAARVDLVLCALTAAWVLGVFTLRPAWRERTPVMVVFVTVLIVLTAVLVVRAPWFGLFTPVCYFYAFRLVPWPWQPVGVGAVAVVAGTAQAYDVDKATVVGLATYLVVVAANALPLCAFAWFARRAARQEEEREQALREAREANRRLAESLAENAALHERLVAQARDAGVRDERERMAREIHDTLAQGLTGIVSQLRAAEHAGDDPAGWRGHVATATDLARESLSDARRSVHALRPEPLRTARLSEALAGVAERWSATHGIPVRVVTTGTARPVRPEAEVALLRIAQEALANVAKHARATRVGVTLSHLERETALDVRDDGTGFDTTARGPSAGGGGFGLIAMRQRIEGLSGTLLVESEPGGGTGISARVPAEPAEGCACGIGPEPRHRTEVTG